MQIHTYTFKYIQELYAPGCAKKCPTRRCPWYVCICMYLQVYGVFVCMSLQIHADTCRYIQIHADTCIYIHIYADSDTCGSQAAYHFTGTIDMGSLHWGHWHVILGNHFTGAIDTGYYLTVPYRRAGLLRADNVLFSELVRKLEIFGSTILSSHFSPNRISLDFYWSLFSIGCFPMDAIWQEVFRAHAFWQGLGEYFRQAAFASVPVFHFEFSVIVVNSIRRLFLRNILCIDTIKLIQ